MSEDERMDVERQIEMLNDSLALQQRAVLQYALTAGSIAGLEFQAHADKEQVDYLLRAKRRP